MRPSPLVLLALAAVPAAACGGDDGGGDDVVEPPVLEGGSIPIDGCGFDVVTREGAEAPVAGTPVLGPEPDPFHIHLGLRGPAATSIAILWRTDDATLATTVRYGTDALDQEVEGVTFRYAAGLDGVGNLVRMHEVHLCGLEPDTEYQYQVGGVGADGESWSPIYRFRTAPDLAASPDAEVLVAYVGDSRGGYDVWGQIAARIVDRAPDLVVFTGDVVTLGPDQGEWDAFFDAAEELLATTPIVTAHGNHEVNAVHYYSLLAMPGDEENFSIDYGPLHQVILNSDPPNVGDLDTTIADFLDADLTASEAPWTVVSMHRSLWSSSTRHGSDDSLRAAWGGIIDGHEVDLVISGHDHIFERTKPMRGEEAVLDGTIYLVSGGAGAPLYGVVSPLPFFSEYAESTYNATFLSIRTGMLTSVSVRDDGSMLDEFALTKP